MTSSSNSEAGNVFNFVGEPPELFKCGVCRLVLCDPHITECCGKNACRSCITKVAEDGGSCPIPGCGSQTVKINFNRGLRSDILESSVYCQSKGAGCGWVGKLDELSTHLKECPFVEEECQYHCGVYIQRQTSKDHEKVCERLPIECHQCGEMYERCRHTDHVKVCPFTKVECPFHIVGCESKVSNKELQKHFDESISEHYAMVVKQSQSVQAQLKEANLMIHDQKEKLELGNTEIDVLNMEIAEAKGMVSNIQHTFEEAEKEFVELQKVHDQLKAQIETHSHYRVATSCMLEKDLSTLMFESKVRCYGPALPLIDPADIVSRPRDSTPTTEEYTPRVSFTIPNFEKERKNDAVLCLPPFYSHNGGYKMCLIVYCRGYREAKGNHLTVLVSTLKGKYDDHLEWPFNCTVTIEIKKPQLYGAGMHRSIEIKSQNRVYEENCLSFQYVGGTKTVKLELLNSCLSNGSLTIDVINVINK